MNGGVNLIFKHSGFYFIKIPKISFNHDFAPKMIFNELEIARVELLGCTEYLGQKKYC